MARVADWLKQHRLDALVRDTQKAHRRYLRALIAHGNHEVCSEDCRQDCIKKVQAKKEWQTLERMVKAETEKRKIHTG